MIRGNGNRVYIAGSMHLLRAGDAALPIALQRAYEDAEALVMEIDLDDVDPAAAARFVLEHGRYPQPDGLRRALGEARWTGLQPWLARAGFPAEAAGGLEPWALALVLSASEMTRAGLEPGLGVEEQLKALAEADGKQITGLETPEFQLGLFDALGEAEQLKFLDLTLDDLERTPADFDRISAAWRTADTAALHDMLLEGYSGLPELYEAVVYRRNANWVPRVRALLGRPDDYLVVVGALHIVGERGLVALLQDEGLRIEPLRAH